MSNLIHLFSNNATTTLASPISSSALSLSVTSGSGALFPNPASGQDFIATLMKIVSGSVTALEIVQVTARSTDMFTIVRAQENTTALAWSAGDTIALLPTAAGLNSLMQGSSGSFTATILGGAGTVPIFYRQFGPIVTLVDVSISCNSVANIFGISGLPVALQPANVAPLPAGFQVISVPLAGDTSIVINGAYAYVYAIGSGSAGQIGFAVRGALNGWTTSGVKSISGNLSYLLF